MRGLHAAAYVLAGPRAPLVALGTVRDRLAHSFGASTTLDLYYAGFRIPDLIFVESAAAGLGIHAYSGIGAAQRGRTARLYRHDSRRIFLICSFRRVYCHSSRPLYWAICSPRSRANMRPSSSQSHASCCCVPILLGLSNISRGHNPVPASLCALCALSASLQHRHHCRCSLPLSGVGHRGTGAGVVIGAFFHAGIQIPAVVSEVTGLCGASLGWREPRALLHTALVSVPRALAPPWANLRFFFGLTAFAGTLVSGSIAVFLMFAYNLASVPLAIIGASYSVAAFPTLAEALSRRRARAIYRARKNCRALCFLLVHNTSALIFVLRAYVVRVGFGERCV